MNKSSPKVVCISGSVTRHREQIFEAENVLACNGFVVLIPVMNVPNVSKFLARILMDVHFNKIRMCDILLVAGEPIGDSTREEIKFADRIGKPVVYSYEEALNYEGE